VDSLTEVFEALMSGKSIRGNDLQKILNDAQATAEEAMNHLENAETDSLTA
jgi:predicted transcriptional regulator